MSTPRDGKPPKSADAIRASLESIHKTAGVDHKIGPDADGLQSEDQLTVASFHDPDVARSYQQLLNRSGIFSTIVPDRQGARVTVDYEDRERAASLYNEHRVKFPDRWPKGRSKRFDCLIAGVTIGLSCGAILFVDAWDHLLAITVPLTFGAIGASCGHLIDCVRMRYYRTGRIGIGVWEFLVLSTLPALITFVWQLFPEILGD